MPLNFGRKVRGQVHVPSEFSNRQHIITVKNSTAEMLMVWVFNSVTVGFSQCSLIDLIV